MKHQFDFMQLVTNPDAAIVLIEQGIDKAKSWVTCAVGNLCDDIERLPNGEPVDEILSDLGSEFHCKLVMWHYYKCYKFKNQYELAEAQRKRAVMLLNAIERRSYALINPVLAAVY